MYFIIPGILVFLAFIIIARFQNEKGLKLLSNEQRGELVMAYSKPRVTNMLILSGIIITFLLVAYFGKVDKAIAMFVYFAVIVVYFVFTGISALRRMKSLNLPAEYMQFTTRATWLRVAGLTFFIILMGIGMYQEFLDRMVL